MATVIITAVISFISSHRSEKKMEQHRRMLKEFMESMNARREEDPPVNKYSPSPLEQEVRIRLQQYSENVENTLRFLLVNGKTSQARLWRFFDAGGFDSKKVFTALQNTDFVWGNPDTGWEIKPNFREAL